MIVKMKYQKIIKYLVSAVCTQPLHIGSASGDKEEVLVHPADDMPLIQASSISGVLRQYYMQTHDEAQTEKLFGAKRFEEGTNALEGASKVRFSDGRFCRESLILELRPRVKINPETGTCDVSTKKGTNRQLGNKFNMEYIGAGAVFGFSIYLYDDSFQDELEEVLSAVHQGNVQFGGQKSNGCGFMKLKGLKRKTFDMEQREDRIKWADEEVLTDDEYEDIFSKMNKVTKTTAAYEVIVTGSTEGELLVKSIAVQDYGKDTPDSVNIRNAAKEYIVPGSSLKGAVRNQMEKIASYLGNSDIIEEIFGKTGDSPSEGKAGNIVFCDTVVGNQVDNDMARIKNRIHIDKFTGGVMHGSLFNEKNVSGKVEFHIVIYNRNHPDNTCGLLLLAIRDMAIGVMSVGGGYSVGKGMIVVDEIVIRDRIHQNEAKIKWKSSTITDENEIISRCMKAVQSKGVSK
ncbi:MAG: hypothetical protein K2N34_06495 [Lachnospiraceae bacterium]|nr:hypothetical protein [Lachnospiraceae bacterium]